MSTVCPSFKGFSKIEVMKKLVKLNMKSNKSFYHSVHKTGSRHCQNSVDSRFVFMTLLTSIMILVIMYLAKGEHSIILMKCICSKNKFFGEEVKLEFVSFFCCLWYCLIACNQRQLAKQKCIIMFAFTKCYF